MTRKAVVIMIAWAISLVGVGAWAKASTGSQQASVSFGTFFSLGGGARTSYTGHADSSDRTADRITYRGKVTVTLPDAHFMLTADEAMQQVTHEGSVTGDAEHDLVLTGNVRLRFVKP